MSGRIADADLAAVRDRVRIDEVVSEHVTLRSAGGGSLKGLCPFHDERSPSFHVTPSKGLYYCFGCGKGGDAIDFLMSVDRLSFTEAVEKLAARTGVTLRFEGGGPAGPDPGQRAGIVAANSAAADWFRRQLCTDAAAHARQFLLDRGFPDDVWEQFGVGYAPRAGLVAHLRGQGHAHQAIVGSGVAGQGDDRTYDRFRDRLVWPIRDLSGDVVGFGARRLADDAGPKYLNTPETIAYRKSSVLYGLYEARRAIAKDHRAVIVEGYTDVMACHLAGVPEAVATCGTAFGEGHVKILRRLLLDDAAGEVVFTFDGDAAGRKAALRAYEEDQQFASRTYVAIARDGLDPCDLRLKDGDEAVRDLVAGRVPLFEFVLRAGLADLDLRTAEGRATGLRNVAGVLAGLRDATLRSEYSRQVAGWLGTDPADVQRQVERAARAGGRALPAGSGRPGQPAPAATLERQALQVILQEPELVREWTAAVEPDCFTDDRLRSVFTAVQQGSDTDRSGPAWIRAVLDACGDDEDRRMVQALATRPLPAAPDDAAFAVGVLARLLDTAAARRAGSLRAALGDPRVADDHERQQGLLGDLMAIEEYRRMLRGYWAGE